MIHHVVGMQVAEGLYPNWPMQVKPFPCVQHINCLVPLPSHVPLSNAPVGVHAVQLHEPSSARHAI